MSEPWSIYLFLLLQSLQRNVLPHNGLEMDIVTMRTTPPSVDLMEEIVVITKWRATPTTAVLANAWKTQVNFNLFKVTYDSRPFNLHLDF